MKKKFRKKKEKRGITCGRSEQQEGDGETSIKMFVKFMI